MKKLVCILFVISTTFGLVGCGENPNTTGGTILGVAAGGLLGSQFGSGGGKIAATILGAAIGGYVGNRIGQYMDKQDQMNYQRAAATVPMGQEAHWENKGTTYSVRPVKNYERNGFRRCREVILTATRMNGKPMKTYGKTCQRPDGKWELVKA